MSVTQSNLVLVIILFFCILFGVSCGKKDFRRDYFTVEKIISGNKIKLINGYVVNLIGIEDNQQTREFLSNYLINHKVRFVFDSKSPFKKLYPKAREKSFYAYVVSESGYCINSKLLKDRLSSIPVSQYYLNDSLGSYVKYVAVRDMRFEDKPNVRLTEKTPSNNLFFSDCKIELDKLKQACDYYNPITRDFAVSLAGRSGGLFNISQICELFTTVRSSWNYVEDPKGMEFYSRASRTIENAKFSGDCDDFAILMYSLITAIGGNSRLVFALGPSGGHAFAEVDITGFSFGEVKKVIIRKFYDYEINSINYQVDANGKKWLNLDWWAAHPGGKYLQYDKFILFYPRDSQCAKSF